MHTAQLRNIRQLSPFVKVTTIKSITFIVYTWNTGNNLLKFLMPIIFWNTVNCYSKD